MRLDKDSNLARYAAGALSEKQKNNARKLRDWYRSKYDPYPYRSYTNKYKAIFIHIPKTAGTSIMRSLGGWPGDHCTYREFLQASPTKFESFYKFSFVRNPYDRLVSAYKYLLQGGNGTTDIAVQRLLLEKHPSFESFVTDYLNIDLIYRVNLLKPQYWFIYDEHDQLQVNFVGRYERVDRDFESISSKFNLEMNGLPVSNVSDNKQHFNSYYINNDVKNKVFEMYRLDFEMLGYQN